MSTTIASFLSYLKESFLYDTWQHFAKSLSAYTLHPQLSFRRPYFVTVAIFFDFYYPRCGQNPTHFNELAQKFPERERERKKLCLP